MYRLEVRFDLFGQDLHQILVHRRQQPLMTLQQGDPGAETGIDRSHLQTDVAAADHQQGFRYLLELQGAGGIHDA